MRIAAIIFIFILGGLSLATVATSQTIRAGDRPTDLISADLGIPEQTFISCFADVNPDRGHAPSGARQNANKSILLPCLQAENASITNDMLDKVMDRYRPEGPMR